MRFTETPLPGAYLVASEPHRDERGYFARLRCAREFAECGLPNEFVQTNLSFNRQAGTFRGLHFQRPPSREGKLVRCLAGAVHDVIVDLRPDSPGFLKHFWAALTADEPVALFVPPGFAHGFLTSTDGALILYEMTDYYQPELGDGIRWDDPALGIRLPGDIAAIHPRDRDYPDLDVGGLECFSGWRP